MRISSNINQVAKPLSRMRLAGGLLAVSFPVGWMISQHINWMQTKEQKIKMAMKHSGFWGGMVASLLTVHHLGFWAPRGRVLQPLLAFIAAGSYPVLGYLGMVSLSRKLYPNPHKSVELSQQKPLTDPQLPVSTPKPPEAVTPSFYPSYPTQSAYSPLTAQQTYSPYLYTQYPYINR